MLSIAARSASNGEGVERGTTISSFICYPQVPEMTSVQEKSIQQLHIQTIDIKVEYPSASTRKWYDKVFSFQDSSFCKVTEFV